MDFIASLEPHLVQPSRATSVQTYLEVLPAFYFLERGNYQLGVGQIYLFRVSRCTSEIAGVITTNLFCYFIHLLHG